jgi:hypothetical protein
MQTTPRLGFTVPASDGDAFDWAPFSAAFVEADRLGCGCGVALPGGGQSISNGVWTAIAYTVELWDTDNMHDNANATRLVAPFTAKYLVGALTDQRGPTDAQNVGVMISTNGAAPSFDGRPISWHKSISNNGAQIPIAAVLALNAGDYIEVLVQQTFGSTQTLQFASAFMQRIAK